MHGPFWKHSLLIGLYARASKRSESACIPFPQERTIIISNIHVLGVKTHLLFLISITCYYLFRWHSNCGNTYHRSVQLYGYKFGAIAVFHCFFYNSLFLTIKDKMVSDLGTFLQLRSQYKLVLSVWIERHCIPFLTHVFFWILQSMWRISIYMYNEEGQKLF